MELKEELLEGFFNIRGNEKIKDLENYKSKLYEYNKKYNDTDINDLINIITALINLFLENNNEIEKIKPCIMNIWNRLFEKDNLTFYEIRIFNCILIMSSNIKDKIKVGFKCLSQLEKYKEHKKYLIVKMTFYLNLTYIIINAKYFDNIYNGEYDEIAIQCLDDIIDININTRMNDNYLVSMAMLRKGILLKDKQLIYIAVLCLREMGIEENDSLISLYMKKYNILL